ncbi:MAG: SRPBCC family protein [Propionibacteriales bacterium]|nr:SRPBCC family protein [Propionibacteriales bacterium]
MARTTSDIVIDAAPSAVMAVIADFDAYPVWATGVRRADVLATGADGRADHVRFTLDAAPIRDTYELLYSWDGDRSVSWRLAEKATVLTALDGTYALAVVDGGTRVTYQLAVDVAVPLLGTLKRKAEKVIIDAALSGLKQRVESLA